MPKPQQILVAGAGIVGVLCALELQRRGANVTIVDPREPGEGCSFGNLGNVSTGAVVPYSMPGTLMRVPIWAFSASGPLSIRPQYLPRLMPWLFQWLNASRPSNVRHISRAMHAMHGQTFDLYLPLLEEIGATGLVSKTGQLNVSRSRSAAEGSALTRALRSDAGVRVEVLTSSEIRDLVPDLSEEFHNGIFLPDNGTCANPFRLVQVFARTFIKRGGKIRRTALVAAEQRSGGGGIAILDGGDRIQYDGLVVAAGAWSNQISTIFGAHVPLEAEGGYHVTLPDPGIKLPVPVMNRDLTIGVASMEMGLRLAGTVEYAGLGAKPNWRRADRLLDLGKQMFPRLQTAGAKRWTGMRPTLPDGLPVLDRAPTDRNVIFAFGNSHFGVSAAPMMARLAASLMFNEPPAIDLSPYALSRFGRRSSRAA